MKKKYYFIPAIYILFIGFFVYLQSVTTFPFEDRTEDISISGLTKNNRNFRENITALKTRIGDVELDFQNRNATYESVYNQKRNLKVKNYDYIHSGLELKFSDNIALRIVKSGGKAGSYTITPLFPDGIPENSVLKIPFNICGEADTSFAENYSMIRAENGNNISFIWGSGKTAFDLNKNEISMLSGKNDCEVKISEEEGTIYDFWFSKSELASAETPSEKSYELFIDKAYKAWREKLSRGSAVRLAKKELESGKLIAAFGAESYRRNEYKKNRSIFNSIVAHNDPANLSCALICGDMEKIFQDYQKKESAELEEIKNKIAKEDISLFKENGIAGYLINRGFINLAVDLEHIAKKIGGKTEETFTAVDIADFYADMISRGVMEKESLRSLNPIMIKHILPNIIKTKEGIFFTDGNISRSETTFKVINIMKKTAGKYSESFNKIADMLADSLFRYADKNAALPDKIIFKNENLFSSEGKIYPEYIYPMCPEAIYYPEIKSLADFAGPETWIASCCHDISPEQEENELILSVPFIKGAVSYIIIKGLKTAPEITLYGKKWPSDPYFESYGAGWKYSEKSRTLFIKLTHQQQEEKIILDMNKNSGPAI